MRQRLAILLLALLAAGCTPDTPAAPSTDTWVGTWRIQSLQVKSQVRQPAPAGAPYQVIFDAARITARVDCNTCVGSFSTAGRGVTIGPVLACTRAACGTAAFESAAVSVLSGDHTAWVSGNSLTLESGRGVILLER